MLKPFSEGISTGIDTFQKPVSKTPSKAAIKSTATKLAKYLISKEGLKLTAKTTARIAMKLTKLLSSWYLAPLIWAPEIIDIATSKEVKALWKEIVEATPEIKKQRMKGLKELEKTRAGVFGNPSIPYGEYYHPVIGWY